MGELQSKPTHMQKVQHLPALEAPDCLTHVLIDLEKNPLGEIDPCAQYKKQFKEAKAAKEEAARGRLVNSFVFRGLID